MAHYERFPRPHPMCTCPPLTFTGPPPDRSKCAGGRIAHPVLTEAEISVLLGQWRADRAAR